MKRSWIGLVLLLVLLGSGILCTWIMEDVHEPISEKLEQAAEEALDRNWAAAAWHTAEARNRWERWEVFRAALTDHGPIEDLDALFSVLEVYGANRERLAFASLCREMAQKIKAIGDAHGLVPENLL